MTAATLEAAPMAKTKARTAAQKRRDKRRMKISLPGGQVAYGALQGIPRVHTRNPDPTPQQVAYEARSRHNGLSLNDCANDMLSCEIGRRLLREHLPDRLDLWKAAMHARKVYAAYGRSIGAPKRHPNSLGIMLPPDAMHADTMSPPPDLRSQEERDTAANAAMQSLTAWLTHTDAAARKAFEVHLIDEAQEPISDWSGIVMSLRCIVDGHNGRRIRTMKRTRG